MSVVVPRLNNLLRERISFTDHADQSKILAKEVVGALNQLSECGLLAQDRTKCDAPKSLKCLRKAKELSFIEGIVFGSFLDT